MKLAAIYNVWDALEHLPGSIQSVRDSVEDVIIVWQRVSNWGQRSDEVEPVVKALLTSKLADHAIEFREVNDRASTKYAIKCETAKRQMGLDAARQRGATHFLHIDADEYYDPEGFREMKKGLEGFGGMSVIGIQNYYKLPTLKLDRLDTTLAPFISSVRNAKCGTLLKAEQMRRRIDFTRCTHEAINVRIEADEAQKYVMHHMSYVRRGGIETKLRNSTARENIYRPEMIAEFEQAGPETVLKQIFTGSRLVEVMNRFNVEI